MEDMIISACKTWACLPKKKKLNTNLKGEKFVTKVLQTNTWMETFQKYKLSIGEFIDFQSSKSIVLELYSNIIKNVKILKILFDLKDLF